MFMNRMIDRFAFDTSVRKRDVLGNKEGKKEKADYGILAINVRNNIRRIARQDKRIVGNVTDNVVFRFEILRTCILQRS